MTQQTVHQNPWFAITQTVDTNGQPWFRLRRPDSVIVAAHTQGRVVFVHGTRDTTGPDIRYELPSGAIDTSDESAEHAAARELSEETGYVARALVHVGSFVDSPGISDARTHVFVGDVISHNTPQLEPGEEWTVSELTQDEVSALITNGRITDGATLATLLLVERSHIEGWPW